MTLVQLHAITHTLAMIAILVWFLGRHRRRAKQKEDHGI